MHERDEVYLLVKQLGFSPKEKTVDIYEKIYDSGYKIEVDFDNETISYGKEVKSDSKTTQNFAQDENFVVLECVDRLLVKGYKPKDITLEKIFPSGHGHSGRLDILVKNGKKAFLMIECKTWEKEFKKEFANIQKNGGQLFTYFQNDTNTDYLMLYTSHLENGEVSYLSEIIKIEDNYRDAGNVEDVYHRWNKITSKNGIFESWVEPYTFQNKLLTKKDLQPLMQDDSGKLFHGFASILRKHSVSDKPNAFNKIFNLFLAKIYDEKKRDTDELDFQWKEGKDDPVEFQIRLINLHKDGLLEFLRKEIVGIADTDFEYKTQEELYKKKKDRLKIDKLFDIKEVFDDDSFDDNFRVLKEVVQLLEKYQIRYPRRQRHLSDFFERLLTTGLKQEAGQYFTPVPITRFIVRSLPVREMIETAVNSTSEALPAVIDYAAGSGHFITEILEMYQDIIDNLDTSNYYPAAVKKVKAWRNDQYSWAAQFIYGIEKDYRLVKVAKVGCYFYGDGLAQIFHGDGLDSFAHSRTYDGLLKKNAKAPQFNIVVSNPPYSVDAFKSDLRNKDAKDDFSLYANLTDRSSEIECLFAERTAQLLKEGGVAGIILPVSILSNTGIYTKAREILLLKFEIIAIAQFGSNTFMETNTNTATFFLKRRNDEKTVQIRNSVDFVFESLKDAAVNGIENTLSRYVKYVWTGLTLSDYMSFLKKTPNERVKEHPLYKEYRPKELTLDTLVDAGTPGNVREAMEKKLENIERQFWSRTIELEKEKFLFFVLGLNKTVILIKTGEKDAEKRFLGYEFSNRRGSEGIHPVQRNKTIDECTRLFDDADFDNPEKASTYIYKAFLGDCDFPIHVSLEENISRVRLVDMLTFGRAVFEKNISLSVKKRAARENIWKTDQLVLLADVSEIKKGTSITKESTKEGNVPVVAGGKEPAYFHSEANRTGNITTVSASGAYSGFVNYFDVPIFASDCNTVQSKDEKIIPTKLIYFLLKSIQEEIYKLQKGQAQPHVYAEDLAKIRIPLPVKEIQEKIVEEIEALEKKERDAKEKISIFKKNIQSLVNTALEKYDSQLLGNLCESVEYGTSAKSEKTGSVPVIRMGNIQDGKIDWTDLVYTSNQDEISKYALKMNDVLFNRTNSPELVGKTGIYRGERPAIFAGYLIRINYKKDLVDPIFLVNILNSETVRNHGFSVMSKSVNQANINGTLLKAYQIPLPPLSEQQKIVAEIERIEAQIQDLKEQLEQFSQQKELVLKKYL